MASGPFAKQMGKAMMASVSKEECERDPEGAFHTMLAVARAMMRARRAREEGTDS